MPSATVGTYCIAEVLAHSPAIHRRWSGAKISELQTHPNLRSLRRAKGAWILNAGVSQSVPKCPVLSPFVLFSPDLSAGHFGTIWETPSNLKLRRVTMRGAQPSARLSEEICFSEGSTGVFPRALRGLSEGSARSLRGSAGVRGIFRGFRG